MAIRLPEHRLSGAPTLKKRDIPLEAILQVLGQNPYAKAIGSTVPILSKALDQYGQRKRDTAVVGSLAEAAGEEPPAPALGITPKDYEGLLTIKTNKRAREEAAANAAIGNELKLEDLFSDRVERDPKTGREYVYGGVQDVSIVEDETGLPKFVRGPNYKPRSLKAGSGGSGSGSGKGGRNQQVGVTAEGYTVSFNPDTKINEVSKPDGKGGVITEPFFGNSFSKTMGTEEQRRAGLGSMAQQSFSDVQRTLSANPAVLNELKGIQYTPGNFYRQLGSAEAKQLYTNISNIIQAEGYATTGATMNEGELERKTAMFMVALNDSPQDVINRLNIATRNLGALNPRGLPTLPVGGSAAPAAGKTIGRFQVEVEP